MHHSDNARDDRTILPGHLYMILPSALLRELKQISNDRQAWRPWRQSSSPKKIARGCKEYDEDKECYEYGQHDDGTRGRLERVGRLHPFPGSSVKLRRWTAPEPKSLDSSLCCALPPVLLCG